MNAGLECRELCPPHSLFQWNPQLCGFQKLCLAWTGSRSIKINSQNGSSRVWGALLSESGRDLILRKWNWTRKFQKPFQQTFPLNSVKALGSRIFVKFHSKSRFWLNIASTTLYTNRYRPNNGHENKGWCAIPFVNERLVKMTSKKYGKALFANSAREIIFMRKCFAENWDSCQIFNMSARAASEMVEMDVMREHDNKPSTAPVQNEPSDDDSNMTKLHRRSTGSKKRQKRARMASSSSLHSLVSILKPNNGDQRSVPNVSFGGDEISDTGVSKDSLDINMNPSFGETSSQMYYGMDGETSFRVPGGSFSTQTSTIGFRASFFSLLEKLSVLRSQDLYKASQTVVEAKTPADRKKSRASVTSLYFRSLYGGKLWNFPETTCC